MKLRDVEKFTKTTELVGSIGFKPSLPESSLLSLPLYSCLSNDTEKIFLILASSLHLCSIAAAQESPKPETPNLGLSDARASPFSTKFALANTVATSHM